jgi:hypothetical protein
MLRIFYMILGVVLPLPHLDLKMAKPIFHLFLKAQQLVKKYELVLKQE